ncbi:MAG: L,D-transpeptidase family protein [Alphaproteobacteria bacterium]|nr:L,D-transpeptidase family protein [Alphaproteobacteria bacterium]
MKMRFGIGFLIAVLFWPTAALAEALPVEDDLAGSGASYVTVPEDTLYDVARRFDLGIVEVLAANPGVDPWMPETGTELVLPTEHVLPSPREGIVINLSELRLFYFQNDAQVLSFPIGIGSEGWRTPTGVTNIVRKRARPVWVPPASIRAEHPELPESVPAGPDNPLGDYAMNLGWPSFVVHGTNRPYGIGKRSSHGCIRLYPEDIAVLFKAVKEGTKVTVIDAPFKLGWRGDTLYLEVTPTQEQADDIADYQRPAPLSIPEVYDAVAREAGQAADVNWYAVEEAVAKRSGIPEVVAARIP